jgi:hypothetical protein
MNRLAKPLLLLALCGMPVMADEDKRAESQDQAHQTTRSEDKRHFEGNMTKLIQDVKALSEEKKTELYRQLVKKIAAAKDPDDPFGNQAEWCLIGVILSQTKSEELMHEILLKTPPPGVGFVSLEEFIKEVPARVLARVIQDSAALRSKIKP